MAYAGRSTTTILAEVAELLTTRIPGLATVTAYQLAERFAGHGRAAGPLRDHLRGRAVVLDTATSDLPLTLVHIAHELHDAGMAGIVLPTCLDCSAAVRQLRNVVDGGRVCDGCQRLRQRATCSSCGKAVHRTPSVLADGLCKPCRSKARPVETCAGCNRQAKIKQRQADGTGLCQRCWHAPTAACTRCGTVARIYQRGDTGPLCRSCYTAPHTACTRCGRLRAIHARTADGPVCSSCHQRPLRECGRCGTLAVWHTRPRDGQPGHCNACHRRPVQPCAACGKPRPVSRSRTRDGAWTCDVCRARRTPCTFCDRPQIIIVRWPIGAACATCYHRIRRTPRPCPNCHEPRVLIGLDTTGTRICADCADLDYDYTCRRCGTSGTFPIHRTCYRCLAAVRVQDLLTVNGTLSQPLQRVADALLAAGTGEAVWRWLAPDHPTAALVTAIRDADAPITHDLLDTLTQRQALHRLRAVLVQHDVLPARVEHLERIEPWLERHLTALPAAHAHLVRTWARWTLHRRARHRLKRRPFTTGAAHYQRSCLIAAIRFLTWIDAERLKLTELNQADIDRWRTEHPHEYSYLAKEFLRWARQRLIVGDLVIAERGNSHNPDILPEDGHWQYLRRALTDTGLPLDVRTASSLNLLYGLTLSRISRLHTDDILHDPASSDTNTYLLLGSHRLRVAPTIAALLHAQTDAATRHRNAATSNPRWIFPGGLPGTHTATLHTKLARHHMPRAAHGRATALINLAAQLPPPLLVDLLGISIDTANHYARHASTGWSTYLNARTTT
ncbi:hypothetical protein [Dactylosporangium sp. CA-139066]|uniref:hypothetical protein n=1 Tax=Dactylosporangium sp. CA-139066 TaxID=3239930 RepID=UPI003D89E140